MTFENTENEIKDLKIDNFQVFSYGELLYPFKNSYFENKFKDEKDQDKLKTIYRMNMPENVRVVSKQPITKYFSTPALNDENKNLIVNYIKDGKVIDFEFNVITKKQITQGKRIIN